MTFSDEFADMFTDTCTVESKTDQSSEGEPIYGPAVTWRGRLSEKARMVRDFQGQEVLSSSNFRFQGAPVIGMQDRVTLQDGSTPTIASFSRSRDETGPAGAVVYFL